MCCTFIQSCISLIHVRLNWLECLIVIRNCTCTCFTQAGFFLLGLCTHLPCAIMDTAANTIAQRLVLNRTFNNIHFLCQFGRPQIHRHRHTITAFICLINWTHSHDLILPPTCTCKKLMPPFLFYFFILKNILRLKLFLDIYSPQKFNFGLIYLLFLVNNF